MRKIIPALLVGDEATFRSRLKAIEPYTDIVQIDVLNNTFIDRASFADPTAIAKIETPLKYELHLMTAEPEAVANTWKKIKNVVRVIFHYEAVTDLVSVIMAIKKNNWEVGIAINPETSSAVFEPYLEKLDVVLFLGVDPGASGQEFVPETVARVRDFVLRLKALPPAKHRPLVAVDGGVNHDTILPLKEAGAELFCAASEIFEKHPSVGEAINELKNLLA